MLNKNREKVANPGFVYIPPVFSQGDLIRTIESIGYSDDSISIETDQKRPDIFELYSKNLANLVRGRIKLLGIKDRNGLIEKFLSEVMSRITVKHREELHNLLEEKKLHFKDLEEKSRKASKDPICAMFIGDTSLCLAGGMIGNIHITKFFNPQEIYGNAINLAFNAYFANSTVRKYIVPERADFEAMVKDMVRILFSFRMTSNPGLALFLHNLEINKTGNGKIYN